MIKHEIFLASHADARDSDPVIMATDIPPDNQALANLKDEITVHHNSHAWDLMKRYTNAFETVTKTHKPPVSRSYYKLLEIMVDHRDSLSLIGESALFIAEGPGGFVEAFYDYTAKTCKNVYCNTLISSNKQVPSWKIPTSQMSSRSFSPTFLNGADGTGDLLKTENIVDMISEIQDKVDFITSDGGFDFSSDFNGQEVNSINLLASAMHLALSVQRPGGSFVLKIFDISLPDTFALLHILWKSYRKVVITKPFTSRPANSEKYVVCMDFIGYDVRDADYLVGPQKLDISRVRLPRSFVDQVVKYNTEFAANQICNIKATLDMIQSKNLDRLIADSMKKQKQCAEQWSRKYGIGAQQRSIYLSV